MRVHLNFAAVVFLSLKFCFSFVLNSASRSCVYPCHSFKKQRSIIYAVLESESEQTSTNNKVKLPIVHIYKNEELVAEFVCGGDVAGSYSKIKATLALFKAIPETIDKPVSFLGVDSIYDDSQLFDEIKRNEYSVFKLFRTGCKKCGIFEPLYVELSANYPKLRWLQGNVEYLPKFVQTLKERLTGGDSSVNECQVCQSSGFIPCSECVGVGHVSRGTMSITCPTCVGNKRVRCPACGGKCISCTSN